MTSILGSPGLLVGTPPPLGKYPGARVLAQNVPVGTTQLLPDPPAGTCWLIGPWVITNTDAIAGNFLIFDSDGALGQTQAWAAGFTAFCQTVSDKAVSITTDVTVSLGGVVLLMPRPEIYLVIKPTDTFVAVPLVIPADKIAVPAFSNFRGTALPVLVPPNNYIRAVNADTAGAQPFQLRLTRGAASSLSGNSTTKNNGVCNQSSPSAWGATGAGVSSLDVLDQRLTAAPIVAGSYVTRAVYELLPAI